ncbi:glycosyltransferase family protein [Undibacterium umbellatum]|uniref:Glycosyl transferase n=1 Tax=Undibacterium umbellatum TaxID=2762300 RepID=A0ABR6ZB95_9BURK|nr:glycosyl transferase [Undibacterium umbellatum]MBC3909037.1 glycosyl transferase [Undibacterium umbellatum]
MMRLVYFSPVPWHSFAQRPHQFVQWFHQQFKARVLWVDPYPTRLPGVVDVKRVLAAKMAQKPRSCSTVKTQENPLKADWLSLVEVAALPIEPLPASGYLHQWMWRKTMAEIDSFVAGGRAQIVVGKPSKLALQAMARHPELPSLYDAMDDFPAFYEGISSKAMEFTERHLAGRVNKIVVSSSAVSRFSAHEDKLSLILNACDSDNLPPALPRSIQAPVYGYVGTIGHWFDWEAVVKLASSLIISDPQARVRLIGPVFTPPPCVLPGNVQILPACSHAEAMRAMQKFSVGLIPFKRKLLTASVDPIKYYEYRSLGIPVLSSNFGEMSLRAEEEGVFLYDECRDFSSLLKTCLLHRSSAESLAQFRVNNSWQARFAGLIPLFDAGIDQRGRRRSTAKLEHFSWQGA